MYHYRKKGTVGTLLLYPYREKGTVLPCPYRKKRCCTTTPIVKRVLYYCIPMARKGTVLLYPYRKKYTVLLYPHRKERYGTTVPLQQNKGTLHYCTPISEKGTVLLYPYRKKKVRYYRVRFASDTEACYRRKIFWFVSVFPSGIGCLRFTKLCWVGKHRRTWWMIWNRRIPQPKANPTQEKLG